MSHHKYRALMSNQNWLAMLLLANMTTNPLVGGIALTASVVSFLQACFHHYKAEVEHDAR
jgi:hypothetical protein